jgi:hypothetical protein
VWTSIRRGVGACFRRWSASRSIDSSQPETSSEPKGANGPGGVSFVGSIGSSTVSYGISSAFAENRMPSSKLEQGATKGLSFDANALATELDLQC